MRQIDQPDDQPGELKRVEKPAPSPKAEPQPVPGRPGILRDADGKLSTDIPTPPPEYVPYFWGRIIRSRIG